LTRWRHNSRISASLAGQLRVFAVEVETFVAAEVRAGLEQGAGQRVTRLGALRVAVEDGEGGAQVFAEHRVVETLAVGG